MALRTSPGASARFILRSQRCILDEMRRVLTAAVLIPVVLVLVFKGSLLIFTLACALVAGLAAWEFLALADATGARTPRIVVLLSIALLFLCAHLRPEYEAPLLGALGFILLGVCVFRDQAEGLGRVLLNASSSLLALIYCGLSMTALPAIRNQEDGPSLVCFLFLAVWMGDIAALYVGRNFGHNKLAPAISPGKTWEGAVASVAGSLLVTATLVLLAGVLGRHGLEWLAYPGPVARWLGLAVLVNVAAQLGDLLESAIKRGALVKDSGTLLPGHGGVLDRIDALLLAAPVLWYALLAQQAF
jgi:phosphatidate cytidylyltransferase